VFTAKRALILFIALLASLCAYAVYVFFFGIIDGMQVLPLEYWPSTDKGPLSPLSSGRTITDQKLEQAFGPGSEELRRPLRLWSPDKGIAFSAGEFTITQETGLVRFAPFSAAFFHKSKTPNGPQEISILKCETAILTLDRPVTQYSELSSRKIIGVEMVGGARGVTIENNRGTVQKSDDVTVVVSNANLFYEERRNLIWTDGVVCLTDQQSLPATVVRGKGLKMLLAKDSGPSKTKTPPAKPAGPANPDSHNVEKITLDSNVQMHFWVDARVGFLGGDANPKKLNPVDKKPAEKAHIHIQTAGTFVYDLVKESAYFDSPPAPEGAGKADGDPFSPEQVHVQRLQTIEGKQTLDQLTCAKLDLQFRRKTAPGAGFNGPGGGEKEIESATALKRGTTNVVLALESERMGAYGTELYYRAGDAVNGPQTILKGEPLKARKDGHRIECTELQLYAANRAGEGQRAWAKGPGQIDLLDPKQTAKDKDVFPTHLLWRDTLTVVKTREGSQVYDLMTVLGDASFIDDKQHQSLHGEKILVWLRSTQDAAKRLNASGSGSNRQELHRVYAEDKVRAHSPEFVVRRTNRLTMSFLHEVARNDRLPDVLPTVVEPKKEVKKDEKPGNINPPELAKVDPAPAPQAKPKQPIELEGNEISVAITTLGPKYLLQELVAKGAVFVYQAGEKAGEKRIDIAGQLLTVRKVNEKGDVLVVHGATKAPARLELGDMVLKGAIVTINQADGRADVDGAGSMEMPSNKNLDGTDAKKKDTRITIYFNKNMMFDGRYAIFTGGVQAVENGARSGLLCHDLFVTLDKQVSFRDGEKDAQKAKIERIVCDKNVYVDDCKVDDKGQFLQRSILQGVAMSVEDDRCNLRGPGQVKLLAKGSGDMALAPAPQGNAQPKSEWKLTHVKFRESMVAKTKGVVKTATFYGSNSGIEVFHFPTTVIEQQMDADRPPKDGLYLRCEILELDAKQEKDRTVHTMIAKTNVFFRTDQYLGYADLVKFDEASDIVIFESLNGNHVRLYQFVNGQPQPGAFNSSKVLYNRRTGSINTEGVKGITN
jgi:hypothetical protein